MDKKVPAALNQLTAALAEAADAEGNSVAVMNAYFVMEQALYWAQKKEAASNG